MSATDADALIAEHIEENPYRPGPADVRLRHTAVPLWALVNYWRVAGEDAARTAADYEIPLEAMQAALTYYQRHPDVIDARIAANAA